MQLLRNVVDTLWSTIFASYSSDSSGLFERMKEYTNRYNSRELHGFKPFVLTLKSKRLLMYINKMVEHETVDAKTAMYNTLYGVIKNVCERLYNHFDPELIYTFNDEIHLVFNGESTPLMFNGNINKILTNTVSATSVYFAEESLKIGLSNPNFPKSCIFEGTCVEFSRDYEAFNYIIWRQFDCKRNNMSLMYAIYMSDKRSLNGKAIDEIEDELASVGISDAIKYGMIIKKEEYNITVDSVDTLDQIDVKRKRFTYSSIDLSQDFKENVNTFLYQKYL